MGKLKRRVIKTPANKLYNMDCLELLQDWYMSGITEFIDFIYIDPPFNSNRDYKEFDDRWGSVSYNKELEIIYQLLPSLYDLLKVLERTLPKSYISYLTNMGIRCWYMKEMLKETGNIIIHCDTNMSHYIKIMMDEEFGENCFRNDIVWLRTQGPYADSFRVNSKIYGKQHDNLLWFSKHPTKYKSNIVSHVKWTVDDIRSKFPYNDNDGKGPYSWERQYAASGKEFERKKEQHELKKTDSGYYYKRYYQKSLKGYIRSDIWIDIPPIAPNSKEKKWPTEKTEEIFIELITKMTDPEDLIFEGYMGSAPACAVAARLGRKFIGCDISPIAVEIAQKRIDEIIKFQDVSMD